MVLAVLALAPGTLSQHDNLDTVLHEWTLAWLFPGCPRVEPGHARRWVKRRVSRCRARVAVALGESQVVHYSGTFGS